MSDEPRVALVDAEARQRIETELGTTFVVEAAAGSGKTTLLVRRLAALVIDRGVPLRRIIATTFTERAAGEITLRLRVELERQRLAPDPVRRAAAEKALVEMEDARIGTLHGIAGELLREVPLEAGIDPDFVVLGQEEGRALRERVVRAHLEAQLLSPPEGLRRWLRRSHRAFDASPIDKLTQALEGLSEQRDLSTPWARPSGFAREAALDALLADLRGLLDAAQKTAMPRPSQRDGLEGALTSLGRMLEEIERGERLSPRDHDALEALFVGLSYKEKETFAKAGRASNWTDKAAFGALKSRRDTWLLALASFVKNANADLAALVRADLAPALDRYDEAKKKEGALDFHDLLALLRATLMARVEVRRIFSSRIDHIVVDEVQDTDPIQLDILSLLAAADPEIADPALAVPAPGKLFIVGDPKQSIYAFRRSSVDGYLRFRDRLVSRGAVLLELTTTFRCAPSIASVVDRAAATTFEEGPYQPAYRGLSPVRPEPTTRPSVIALPIPKPYGYRGDVHEMNVRAQIPDLVAGLVHFLVKESGWQIPDPHTGRDVPLRAAHIALLARSFSVFGVDQIGPMARALERRGIAHAHVGGRSFHQQEEIVALRAVANAIEFPDDELSVYATLRGPFLAFADADLFTYRGTIGALHPFAAPADRAALTPAHADIAEALSLLSDLHRRRARCPIEETLTRFLTASAALLSLAVADDGELALARAQRWVELAAHREARGALSFRRFVEDLEDAAARGEDVVVAAPDGIDAVRFSTVHLAKGLEWPVVILVDPTTKPEGPAKVIDPDKGLYVDRLLGLEPSERAQYAQESEARGRAEGARLLYVAATRARDLLVIPTTGDRPIGQWLGPLEEAIRPAVPRAARPLASGPAFGARTVLARGDLPELDAPPSSEVAPGMHELEGGARVVYWDPELLTRGATPVRGVRGQALFTEVKGVDGGEALRSFGQARQRLDAVGREGGMELVPLSQLGIDLRAQSYAQADVVEPLALGYTAPKSKRLSRLVRALLSVIGEGDRARMTGRLRRVGLELGASAAELADAQAIADALLAHPDLGPLVPTLRATPITAIVSARLFVEGELFVTDFSEALGGALAIEVHAGHEPDEVVAFRLAVAATAHAHATEHPVRAILVKLEVA